MHNALNFYHLIFMYNNFLSCFARVFKSYSCSMYYNIHKHTYILHYICIWVYRQLIKKNGMTSAISKYRVTRE